MRPTYRRGYELQSVHKRQVNMLLAQNRLDVIHARGGGGVLLKAGPTVRS